MRMRTAECGLRIGTALALCLLCTVAAKAATGVSEERVSLPEGPGSLEGLGENIELNLNMAQMSYNVNVQVPEGYAGMTPGVSLDYSSGSGNSVVGMGWTLSMPNIERLTVRGLPRYVVGDEFAVDGSAELVYVGGTSPRIYRARFEGSYVRYSWYGAASGAEGYWTAEYPDGRISYYGADREGTLVTDSRVSGTAGTFRYHLVETVDRYGHIIHYSYDLYGNVTLMNHIGWVFVGDQPQYEVSFEYENRSDNLSDCRGGFEELLTKRLMRVNVRAHQTLIRQYELAYEDYAASGGFTRLAGVKQLGADGGVSPIQFAFEYSRALGVQCVGGCEKPYVVAMGSLGVDIAQGKTTLLDINGDSLPDVLDTTEVGQAHRFFLNHLAADGNHSFSPAVESAVGTQSSHAKGSPFVHELDLDGDGFTDLINAQTGLVLVNKGSGDWTESKSAWQGDGGLPDLGAEGTLASVKFLDYDGDKKIDLVFSQGDDTSNNTMVFRNTGTSGFASDGGAMPLGVGFETPALELNDMNGDGLLDVVVVTKDALRYRLNLGWGHWSEWQVIEGFTFTDQEALQTEVEDLNGDGLADLCLVAGNELRYWINRNGASFDPEVKVTSADITGSMPERLVSTTVLHADMNGNGSSDVVWVQASGQVTYLELFPVRPNLLTRITNGLGRVTDVTYVPSVQERARDQASAPWEHPLPFPMTVVKSTDEWDELSGVHSITEYMYHDGFYDGVEKRFRGYSQVEGELAGDALQESGYTLEEYDVGISDPYRAGLLTREEQRSDGQTIQITEQEYADCELAEVPTEGVLYPVRHVCQVGETIEHREGLADPSQWATTTTRWEHDGYGNVVLESKLGVTDMGGGPCQPCVGTGYTGTPCGPECLGDEAYTRTTYAQPADNDGRWILRKAVRTQGFGVADAQGDPATDMYTETTVYYDGPEFQGLAEGKVTHGTPTRVVTRLDTSDATVTPTRSKLDAHGNVIETLDPLGEPGGTTHRRVYTMDDEGIDILAVEILNEDELGAYALRQEMKYDLLWSKPVEATAWMKVVDGEVVGAPNATYYTYDEFGRITAIVRPGDSMEKPTQQFEYDLASPVSAVRTLERSESGKAPDLETVRCVDGRGREVQTRVKLDAQTWRVKGFSIFNVHGSLRTAMYPYLAENGACAISPPGDVDLQEYRYDALGRKVETHYPPVGSEDKPAVERTLLRPLDRLEYDREDTLEGGPHFGTPTRIERNGLDQILLVERTDKPNGTPLVHTLEYDELGRIAAVVDPIGARITQKFDLLGRVVEVVHPDAGKVTYEFDKAGNLVRTQDARGTVVRTEYDGANRTLARWDEADKAGTLQKWFYDRISDCPESVCSNLAGKKAGVDYPLAGATGGERLGYSTRGLEVVRRVVVGERTFDFATIYDNAGRIVGQTYPDGQTLASTLDASGMVKALPGFLDNIAYEEDGLPLTVEAANGVVTEYAHDRRKQLTGILATAPDDQLVLAYTLERDQAGNVLEVTDDRADDDAPLGGAVYSYDSLYRLVKAELDKGRPGLAETLTMSYDAGDRTLAMTSDLGGTSPAHVGTLTYGASAGPHAVTKAGDLLMTYGPSGLLGKRGDTSYTWDAFGRLTEATEGGKKLARFEYGEDSDRLLKEEDGHRTHYLAEEFEVVDGTASTYVSLGEHRYARIDDASFAPQILSDIAPASGSDTALASSPDGIITSGDAWLAAAVQGGSLTLADSQSPDEPTVLLHASAQRMLFGLEPRVVWLHEDALGSVVAETDSAGKVVARNESYPYGKERYSAGETDRHGFAGKETDDSTGLAYFGSRYLDPWTGRWTAPDPSFLTMTTFDVGDAAEATGSYAYVGNSPASNVDPDGCRGFNPSVGYVGNMKKTVRALQAGTIRPSIAFATLFSVYPKNGISKQKAWEMVKTAKQMESKEGSHAQAFVKSKTLPDSNEWARGMLDIRSSTRMQVMAHDSALGGSFKDFGFYSAQHGATMSIQSQEGTREGMFGKTEVVKLTETRQATIKQDFTDMRKGYESMGGENLNAPLAKSLPKTKWQKFKGSVKKLFRRGG